MKSSPSNRENRKYPVALQGGFSIVELMIAITLGLLILAGVTTIFVKNSQVRNEVEQSNRQIESGRYATTLLTEDLRMAGFLASFDPYELIIQPGNPPLPLTSKPDPCDATLANLRNAFFLHVQGVDNAAAIPSCLSDVRTGSDIIVIRRASTCIAGPVTEANCDAVIGGAPYFQSSNCYQATELAMNSGTNTDYQAHFVLDSNTSTGLIKRALNCTTQADYRRFLTHIYFVANNNVGSDGIPTLKRADLGASGFTIVPLVEGIETIQFEYGVDNDDNGLIDDYTADPDLYNSCAGAACIDNWLQTYAVKVNVLARNTKASPGYSDSKTYTLGRAVDGSNNIFGPYNDNYKRHAYTATVRLDNPSGRRVP